MIIHVQGPKRIDAFAIRGAHVANEKRRQNEIMTKDTHCTQPQQDAMAARLRAQLGPGLPGLSSWYMSPLQPPLTSEQSALNPNNKNGRESSPKR